MAKHRSFFKNGLRYHRVDGIDKPGVTTVLGATKDAKSNAAIEQWRQRTSEAEQLAATKRGTVVHKLIEDYYERRKQCPNLLDQYGEFWQSVEPVLDKIKPVYTEKFLHSELGYAGTCDAWGLYQDRLTIVDFKTSTKPKKREWCVDHLCQLVAYAAAMKEQYGHTTEQGLIVVALPDRKAQMIRFEKEEMLAYWDVWLYRLARFNELIDSQMCAKIPE